MNRSASDRAISPPDAPPVSSRSGEVVASGDEYKPRWLRTAEERLQGYRSLLETLTEEDWEFLRNYDGPEVLGPPPPPPMPRRPRRRGET